MRIRVNTNDDDFQNTDGSVSIPDNLAVKVEVVYNDDDKNTTGWTNWIGLERSYGNGVATSDGYCNGTNNSAHGKRLYFTTDLTTNTLAGAGTVGNDGYSTAGGQTVIVPIGLNNNNQVIEECVWIYVDECLQASTDIEAIRSAEIHVINGEINNGNFVSFYDTLKYTINQHQLFEIKYTGEDGVERTYYIEHEEEYLYNFDADDTYTQNQTQFEGMTWGLDGVQLSFLNDALFFDSGMGSFIDGIIDWFKENSGLKVVYDFYVKKHDTEVSSQAVKYEYNGLAFSKKIINDINGVNSGHTTGYVGKEGRENNIKKLALDQEPHSAIEYCYNRNKRNADGTITTNNITWYMPAIDEMEDIMMGGYSAFEVFQDKFYWSCQPAYMQNYAYYDVIVTYDGVYYCDDIGVYSLSDELKNINKTVGRARATKVVYKEGKYDYAHSGVDGYDDALNVYFDWGTKYRTIYKDVYNTQLLYDWNQYDPTDEDTWMDYDEGNKLRTDKCRVRVIVDPSKVKK